MRKRYRHETLGWRRFLSLLLLTGFLLLMSLLTSCNTSKAEPKAVEKNEAMELQVCIKHSGGGDCVWTHLPMEYNK